jgi:16S rRNA (adenine1518-N6/adenine1519-N6)-dimethyltransferase
VSAKPVPPAKKSLGQCFLVERAYAWQIADALGIRKGETVLEVGPGRGMLTEALLERGAHVIAIEIDQRLLEGLRERFGSLPNFELRHEDFLETDIERLLPSGSARVAGNLPYHLVAQITFKLLEHARRARHDAALPWIETAVLMMQKEVADRVTARPGGKAWSRISVFTQLEATARAVATVPAGAFRPVPQVDGGVVRLDFQRLTEHYPRDFQVFERIVRYTFHQRRKMLKSSLAGLTGIHPFWQEAAFDFTRRPETLSPAEWVEIADVIAAAQARRDTPRGASPSVSE